MHSRNPLNTAAATTTTTTAATAASTLCPWPLTLWAQINVLWQTVEDYYRTEFQVIPVCTCVCLFVDWCDSVSERGS